MKYSVATNAALPKLPAIYDVQIAGQSVFVVAGSLLIDSSVGRRSQASFVLKTDTSMHFQQYQQVLIYDQTRALIFSGYITTPKEQKPGFQNSLLHTITCVDQHFLADKRRVAATYVNKTCGYIVQDILNNVLSQEGVTVGQIYDGPTPSNTLYPSATLYPGGNVGLIPAVTFVYAKVSDALDALVKAASASGVLYYWMIDQNKRLWFVPYTAVVNNTLVDGSQIEQVRNPPTVVRANPTYRNQQYITGGTAQTVQQTETRKGDGVTVAWTMGYALSTVPTITVNGTAKTVGIKGLDTGKDYYWAKGDPIITQDSAGTKLTSSDTLQVVYVGQYPNVVIAQNGAQVAYQSQIDGSTGIIEDVQQDATISTVSDGLSEAGQLLARYGVQGVQLIFTTLQKGFQQGQLVTVNLPMFNLNNVQMLIEKVTASDQADGINIWYTVQAILGPYDTSWVDFFSKMLAVQAPPNSINVGVSQSLTILVPFTASIRPTAALTATPYSCPLPGATQYPNTTLLPC